MTIWCRSINDCDLFLVTFPIGRKGYLGRRGHLERVGDASLVYGFRCGAGAVCLTERYNINDVNVVVLATQDALLVISP
jgi:hypothetical protein